MIDGEKLVALDIETSNGNGKGSLEPRKPGSVIALVQLGYENGDIELYDWNKETEKLLQKLIEEDYRFIIHNASFELDWFGIKSKLRFPKIWCTFVASQVLNAGKTAVDEATILSGRLESKNTDYLGVYEPIFHEQDENIEGKKKAGIFSHSYQAVAYRYANGAKVTKDQGTSDWLRRPLTAEQVRYAKDDVRYGVTIARNQWNFMKSLGLDKVAELEMNILNAIADMKLSGIKVDTDNWNEAASEYGEKAVELEIRLNKELGLEAAKKEGILSVFGTFVPKAFKVSSPSQLAKFFDTENADEATLRAVEHPLISDILTFKEYNKIASTYGDSYLKHIWSYDNRIHSALTQAATATGRFSSRAPALQTIPPDMIKSFLTTDDDKWLVFVDYSSVESRILAYAANDANFIDSVNSKDVHSENARKIFKIPQDSPVDAELRRKAKVLCVVGDSLVWGQGFISEIAELKEGVSVQTDAGIRTATNFYALGKQKVITVKLAGGQEITGTHEHPLFVIDEFSNYVKKELRDIRVGDTVVCKLGDYVKPPVLFESEDSKLAYLVGGWISEGCYTEKHKGLDFSNTDEAYLTRFESFLSELSIPYKKYTYTKDNYKPLSTLIVRYRRHLKDWFNRVLGGHAHSANKEIPKWILNNPTPEVVFSLLSGLWDGDGSVSGSYITYSTISRKLAKQLQNLLMFVGINSYILEESRESHLGNRYYKVSIHGAEFCEKFLNSVNLATGKISRYVTTNTKSTNGTCVHNLKHLIRANKYHLKVPNRELDNVVWKKSVSVTTQRLKELAPVLDDPLITFFSENNLYTRKVTEVIVEEKEQEVFDITVEDRHRFIANGIVSHNTFGVPYGVSAVGLVNRGLADTVEESQDLLDTFFKQYPSVNKFLKNSVGEALTQGFTQDIFGRIRWYEVPKKATEEEIRQATSAIARQAQNFKIQSSSANITKQAIKDLHEYLTRTGYGYMLLSIHDSIIFELYKETAAEAVAVIKELMEAAGPKIIPGIITPVDVDVGHKIKRTCVVSGLKFSVFTHVFDGKTIYENTDFIEKRVKQLLEQNGLKADFQARANLREVINTKSDEWKEANKDLVAALR